MKKKLCGILIILLLVLQVAPAFAQEEEEEPLPPPRKQNAPKVGGGGGFTPVWLLWDVDAFNSELPLSVAKFSKSPMLLLGGGGYAYIMLLDNLRVGGMGLGGSTKSSAISGGVRRDVEVSVGFGGVTIEYAISIFNRLDIVPGIMLGGGGMDITTTRDNGSFKFWGGQGGLWDEFDLNSPTQNVTRKMSGSFFVYVPSVQIEFALLRWVGLRAGVSYVGMSSPSWKLDQRFDVVGVPTKINGQGWTINTGIFIGTFLY